MANLKVLTTTQAARTLQLSSAYFMRLVRDGKIKRRARGEFLLSELVRYHAMRIMHPPKVGRPRKKAAAR